MFERGKKSIFSIDEKVLTLKILDKTFILIRKIGVGSTSEVFLGYNPKENPKVYYSFKIFRPNFFNVNQVKNEISMLESISSNNMIKLYHYGEGKLQLAKEEPKTVFFLQLEYIEKGELIDYIYIGRMGFGEEFGKIIFTFILDAIDSIHSIGIVHRDIKADNIMFSKDYTIKIVDFGFATRQTGEKLTDYKGTLNYCSPNVLEGKPYNGVANDLFSLGVTLFVIVTGCFPFEMVRKANGNYEYWINRKFEGLSVPFMQLINALLSYDETLRPSISEIRKSEWMKDVHMELIPRMKEKFDYLFELLTLFQDKMMIQKLILHERAYEEEMKRITKKRCCMQ